MYLDLPYLGPLSLQTRTIEPYLIGILNCCKLQIVFKSRNKLANLFVLKTAFTKYLRLLSFINIRVDSAINPTLFILRYGECVRHLNIRTGEHIGISPLTKKKVKSKGDAVSDHLLLWNHSPSFENFDVLTNEKNF